MMGGWAILLAVFTFLGSMAVPLFAQRWQSLLGLSAAAALFFGWLTLEVDKPDTLAATIGAFLGGLMLTGFAFVAIARFVMLVGRRPDEVAEDLGAESQERTTADQS
jgi:hypothetical protein